MLETREFIATGSTMSLKDVIDDVFLSSSVTEQGKLKIEAENAEFYKGIILNCSAQYSAESVIEAANTVMASYLRNKYNVDLIVPEPTGSRHIPTIGELDVIVSASILREITREFSGSIDDWWTKKWQTVSGSVPTLEEVDSASRHTWITKWGEVSGSLVDTGSFPIHWNHSWKEVSGSYVDTGSFGTRWDNNWKKISGSYVDTGSFVSRWNSKWNEISGSYVDSGSFDTKWDNSWKKISGSYVDTGSFGTRWNKNWNEISGSYVDTGSFVSRWNSKWNEISGGLVPVNKFAELFESGLVTKQIWSGSQIEDWVTGRHFLVSGSVLFKNGILDTISSSGYPTHDPVSYFIDQVSQSGQYLKSNEFNLVLNSHSLYIASSSKHTMDYAASASLMSISASKAEMLNNNATMKSWMSSSQHAIFLDVSASKYAVQTEISASRNQVNSEISASRNDVRTETSASRYAMEQTRLAVIADVQTTISQSTVGEVQAAVTQLQTSLAAAQTSIASTMELVQTVSASIVTQSLDMPDWRKIDGWVQNDGIAFIDLDYESTRGWILKAVIQPESLSPNPNYIIGRITNEGEYIDGIALTDGNSSLANISSWFGDNPGKMTVALEAVALKSKNGLEIINTEGKQTITVDGKEFAANAFSGDTGVKGTLYLMAAHSDQGSNIVGQNIKYVSVKIYSDKGNLVRDLYPAFDRDSNEACMYDYVSKTYFKNAAGSGKFEVSKNVRTAWNA